MRDVAVLGRKVQFLYGHIVFAQRFAQLAVLRLETAFVAVGEESGGEVGRHVVGDDCLLRLLTFVPKKFAVIGASPNVH